MFGGILKVLNRRRLRVAGAAGLLMICGSIMIYRIAFYVPAPMIHAGQGPGLEDRSGPAGQPAAVTGGELRAGAVPGPER